MAHPRSSFDALYDETRDYALLRNAPRATHWTLLRTAAASRRAAIAAWAATCPLRVSRPRPVPQLRPRTR
jgi:hypothetical protein